MNKKIIMSYMSILVLLAMSSVTLPFVSAQALQMADEFGVNDATGDPGDYVLVPVNITNVNNGPIQTIKFDVLYNHSVIELDYDNDHVLPEGNLTTGPSWTFILGRNQYSVTLITSKKTHAIPNGSTGSAVLLNFSVVGTACETSPMNMSKINFASTDFRSGTAPAKNGTFFVDGIEPSVELWKLTKESIIPDGIDHTELYVEVTDECPPAYLNNITVTVNLSSLGWSDREPMEQFTEKIWRHTNITAKPGTRQGLHNLTVTAIDVNGNNGSRNVSLNISGSEIEGYILRNHFETGIDGAIVNLTKDDSVINSTITNETGYYNFTNVAEGNYTLNARKPKVENETGFWNNSANVTVNASDKEEVRKDLILWLKGDLNNNGESADAVDVTMMIQASVGDIPPLPEGSAPWEYYNLDGKNGVADAVDVTMMIQASVGDIILEDC